jgi:two-component system response regulator
MLNFSGVKYEVGASEKYGGNLIPTLGKPIVLLAEDNPNDLELTVLALADGRCSNRLDVVRDGAEALDYLFRRGEYADRDPGEEPRVILLDIKLPLVNGVDVLRAIKADERTRHLPVVMLTSSDVDRDLEDCYQQGVNSYIVKPVDIDSFFEAIHQVGLYWLVLNRSDGL